MRNMDKTMRAMQRFLANKAISDAGLYIAKPQDIEGLAEIAMDAYQNYPLHLWLTNGRYDCEISKRMMEISLQTLENDGIIYADSAQPNGFAVWLPPGFTGTKAIPFLTHGGFGLLVHAGVPLFKKLLYYEGYAMRLKKQYTSHTDWYLYNLSVSCRAQGKGIATKLLRPMLDLCDRQAIPCYLETHQQSNVALYEHFGFDLAEQSLLAHSQTVHYAMMRIPKPVMAHATKSARQQ